VVDVMMVVVVMVMMVVVMMHLMGHRGGGGCGRGFLRDGIARETDGESGGGDKALDHRNLSSGGKDPSGLCLQFAANRLNSI
jgi:hypothetical protein